MFKGFVFLLKYVWQERKSYVFYQLLLQLAIAVIPLADIAIPKYIIDELTGNQDIKVLVFWIAVLLAINLLGTMLVSFLKGKVFLLQGQVFTQFQTMMAEKLSKCDFERLEDPHFLDAKAKAEQFLYANGKGFAAVLTSAFNILGNLISFLGIVVIIATLDFWVLVLFVVLILINAYFEANARKRSVQWDLEKAPIERKTNYLLDLIENFAFGKEIRIFGFKDWLVAKINHHLIESNGFYKKQVQLTNRVNFFAAFTNFLLKGITYIFLVWSVLLKAISLGDFTMYTSALLSFSNSMQSLMKSLLDIRQFGGYYDALQDYMNVPQHMYEGKQLPIPEAPYQIQFENVSFRYPGQDHDVLHNINITIHAGEKLSIVGENGAGKTTFVKLLCRLYDPTSGRVLLNGVDIRDLDYEEYMRTICSVFQDYKLLAFTLKENVVFDDDEKTLDTTVNEILTQSGLASKLENLPNGVHTHIYKTFEDDGFEPSGGEGQKIALARAIYKDASIMILDEPTSALDPRSEYEIYRNFSEITKGKTAVFISHRMSSSRFCDYIALFKNGCIEEYGTHDELMQKEGAYKELYEMQAQYYLQEKECADLT